MADNKWAEAKQLNPLLLRTSSNHQSSVSSRKGAQAFHQLRMAILLAYGLRLRNPVLKTLMV
jgi:hypothetical protein